MQARFTNSSHQAVNLGGLIVPPKGWVDVDPKYAIPLLNAGARLRRDGVGVIIEAGVAAPPDAETVNRWVAENNRVLADLASGADSVNVAS